MTLQTRDGDHGAGGRLPGDYGRPEELQWEDEAEYVKARPIGIRMMRAAVAIVILGVIFFVGYRIAGSWFGAQLDPEGEPGEAVAVVIPAGSSTAEIGSLLEAKEVIPNGTFFRYYVQWRHGSEEFQAGDYTLNTNMSADEAILALRGGPKQVETGEFLIPEGLWISEMLPRIAEQVPSVTEEELRAVLDSGQITPRYRPEGNDSWEGLLFPAKYFVEEDITAVELLAKMNNEFASVTGELGYGTAERRHNLSAYEVVVIASLIQSEAKTEEDMGKISRVIYNRLEQGKPLQIDATFLYGAQDRQLQILNTMKEVPDDPYNSYDYNNPGLPPTPISAPGAAALEAAMNPTDNPPAGCTEDSSEPPGTCDWIYYVLADADGTHFFTHDYDEFLAQKAISAEAGLLD